jgi:hypothetical protein
MVTKASGIAPSKIWILVKGVLVGAAGAVLVGVVATVAAQISGILPN